MERLNHHHLLIFWTLAREGTFTGAAQALSISQSAVTSQIKSLEEVLGFELIDRANRRKPTLTGNGNELLKFADSIFETSTELMRWAKHGEPAKIKTLRIGALSGLSRNLQYHFLQPVIGDPAIKIELTIGDQNRLVKLLCEHSIDIILSSHNVKPEGKGSFFSHVLMSSDVVFVLRAKDRLRGKACLQDYLKQRSLYIPGKSFEVRPELEAFLDEHKALDRVLGEIDDVALLRLFALRTGALVAIPEMGVREDLLAKSLLMVGKAGHIQQRFYAITRQRKFPNSLIEKLIQRVRV